MTSPDVRIPAAGGQPSRADQRVALMDLLDRVLSGGVVISGEVTLTIADVDMVHVSLRACDASVDALQPGAVGGGTVGR